MKKKKKKKLKIKNFYFFLNMILFFDKMAKKRPFNLIKLKGLLIVNKLI